MAKGEPKLKDIVVVLMENQEQIENSIGELSQLNESFSNKISELKNTKLEIDTSTLVELQYKLDDILRKRLTALVREDEKTAQVLRDEREAMQILYKERKRVSVPATLFTILNILMVIINVTFFIYSNHKNNQTEDTLHGTKEHFEQYLQETDQIADYNEWSAKVQQK